MSYAGRYSKGHPPSELRTRLGPDISMRALAV